MSFVLSTKHFPNSIKNGLIFTKTNSEYSQLLDDPYKLLYLKGEIFEENHDLKNIGQRIIDKGFEGVSKFDGEFSLVYYDKLNQTIYIGNDCLGREALFYYHSNDSFILSDNFWEIVFIIQPDEKDINVQGVFESILLERSLDNSTIIKDLNFFPSASIGKFSLRDERFTLHNYWDFAYSPQPDLGIRIAIDQLDTAFIEYAQKLANIFPSETKYLLGLSGGLDSRLVAAYCQKTGMDVTGFIIGDKRPNGLLVSRDYANAYSLARYFHMDLQELEYDKTPYAKKLQLEAKYFPIHQARLFHTQEIESIPDHDVLLNGLMGGETFGSEIREESLSLSPNKLADHILSKPMYLGKLFYPKKPTIAQRGLRKVFGVNPPAPTLKSFMRGEEPLERLQTYIRDYVICEAEKGKNNLEIQQKLLFYLISNGKYGSFCMYPGKPNLTFFLSLFYESLNWPQEFFINKKLQTEFFRIKHPKIAKIPAQDYREPIYYRNDPGWRKKYYHTMYRIRGTSILSHKTFAYQKEYLEFASLLLQNANPIIENLFDTKKMLEMQIAPTENLLKVKYLLDIILQKNFMAVL